MILAEEYFELLLVIQLNVTDDIQMVWRLFYWDQMI